MSAQLINGRAIARSIRDDIRARIDQRLTAGLRAPGLGVILVGDDPASHIYVRYKERDCKEVGMVSSVVKMPRSATQREVCEEVDRMAGDPSIDGFLVQLPLPEHLDKDAVVQRVPPAKDVDGFHPYNTGRLVQRAPSLRPCTPFGVIRMLEHVGEPIKGRHAVVVGASNIVGRPMMLELLLSGATVTICHRFTKDLEHHVRQADILVVAVGKPGLVKGAWIKPGATVVDVGINRLDDGTLVGDVEFELARERAALITPVPGGVGPMTRAMLLYNTLEAAMRAED